MLVVNHGQRKLLVETVRDIANIAAGAVVFGQFLADEVFSPWLAVGGVGIWIGFVAYAMTLARNDKP